MLDVVQYMRTKCLMSHNNNNISETYRSFSLELDQCTNQLSKLILSPARDLDNLSSYLTASFSSIANSNLSPSTSRHTNIISPIITVDSGKHSDQNIHVNDLSHFKFGPSIVLAYPCDMIASNGRTILSYVIEKNFLNYSTVAGINLSSIKVYRLLAPITANNARLWDMIWCPWSKFYLM